MVRSYMYENKSDNRRRQREEEQFQLRQKRRDDALNKKRSTTVSDTSRIPNFSKLKNNLLSNSLKEVFQGTYEFRMMLSVETLPPIQEVIDTNLVPRFVELLSINNVLYKGGDPDLVHSTRLESAWVLTNIASGNSNQTKVVVECGAIPLLLQMLKEGNDLVDQSVWALGNIAGDSEGMRDAIINCNCLGLIIQLFNKKDIKIIRNATWLLSNLCRGRNPCPGQEHLKSCLPVFVHLMAFDDMDVIYDAFWALSYICEADPSLLINNEEVETQRIPEQAENKVTTQTPSYGDIVLNRARNILDQGSTRMVGPIIRMLGNIATGDAIPTDVLISRGFLPVLKKIFYEYDDHKKLGRVRKEICWTISNICAGTRNQAESVVKSELIPMLVEALSLPEMYVRVEACWALTNCIDYLNLENYEQMLNLKLEKEKFEQGPSNHLDLIEELKKFLAVSSSVTDIQEQILDAFKKMLVVGNELERKTGRNVIKEKFVELDVVMDIEELQMSSEKSVSDRAYELIVDFFDGS